MAQIAISMHDKVHAEIYHFCEQANTAQEKLKVRTMFFGDTLPQLFMNKRIQAHKACEAAFRLKSKHDMRSEDFLILLVNGDLYDEEDREYYFVTSDDYPNLKARDLGVGIISLFYTHPTSTFMRALRSRRRALSAADKAVIL